MLARLTDSRTNRRPPGCRKLVGSEGDYRMMCAVDDAVLVVVIESIRHRREAYR